MGLYHAQLHRSEVRLSVIVCDDAREHGHNFRDFKIICEGPVDYTLRPPNPATLMGGPHMKFHEQHPLLDDPQFQFRPGDDGERYDPPLKLKLLILDQSQIIAQRFLLEEPPKTPVQKPV